MAIIKYDASNTTRLGIPSAYNERSLIRCLEYEYTNANKKGNPMLTTKWELCGYFMGSTLLQVKVEGKVTYRLGGLKIRPNYQVIKPENINFFADFYKVCTGKDLPAEIDTDTLGDDLEWLQGLALQAIVTGKSQAQRRAITDEEREEKIAKGEEPVGDILTDENGQEIVNNNLEIKTFLKKYTGDVPEFE